MGNYRPSQATRIRRYARRIRPAARSVPRLRSWTRRRLRSHPRVGDVALVVSELATNALVHGAPVCDGKQLQVELWRWDGEAEVSVTSPVLPWDGFDFPLAYEDFAHPREVGRGLTIVDAVSDAWGLRRSTDAVTVWARFLPVQPSPHPADTT